MDMTETQKMYNTATNIVGDYGFQFKIEIVKAGVLLEIKSPPAIIGQLEAYKAWVTSWEDVEAGHWRASVKRACDALKAVRDADKEKTNANN